MLFLAVALWFMLTIPVGIFVGRRIAARRSTDKRACDHAAASKLRTIATKLDKSA
jgi:hypothetical protein